ncbi:MAG TPA: aspartate ammonia-lyase [Thermoplasmataceae archaeon]|nr:aspartate ammonia-lyase [Thermoplasmatales archaeon AK]HLH85717.1 aspartate ammonia-lyase [Thermoplasmataceae archaeon]
MSRKERDVIGEVTIDDSCYYGINTYRARENFRITGQTADSDHIRAAVTVKRSAAIANYIGGKLPKDKSDLIVKACDRILSGSLHDQFVIDVFQAGAGTSYNMNANEVIANLALELGGKKKGDYDFIHPNDHVNMSQSTNDVYPTIMRLVAYEKAKKLSKNLEALIASLRKKAQEFKDVVKPGRTHLQDAAPVTLGLELSAWAYALDKDNEEIKRAMDSILELNIGGTAVGTGINTAPNYQDNVVNEINKLTGNKFRKSSNLPGIMQFMTDFSRLMNAAANTALDLNKISNDIRLLYSGPGAGIHEIRIPAVQQGSSIMPGKINPSIAEAMNMICHSVIGAQQALNISVQAGQLELNVMMPHIDYELTRAEDILANGIEMLRTKLIDGLGAEAEVCREHLSKSFGSAALLNPVLGYDTVAQIVKKSLETGKPIKALALETGRIDEATFDRLMAQGIPKTV